METLNIVILSAAGRSRSEWPAKSKDAIPDWRTMEEQGTPQGVLTMKRAMT